MYWWLVIQRRRTLKILEAIIPGFDSAYCALVCCLQTIRTPCCWPSDGLLKDGLLKDDAYTLPAYLSEQARRDSSIRTLPKFAERKPSQDHAWVANVHNLNFVTWNEWWVSKGAGVCVIKFPAITTLHFLVW
jgi:hypothetical protein